MISAITLNAVSKTYSSVDAPALHGVNLDILPGSSTAIVGPSGSGKSTILRIIAGLEDANGGEVRVNGRDVTAVLPEHRGIGMVFQRPLLFPHLSVVDNVAFADRAAGMRRRDARARALHYLALVKMDDFASRAPTSLSGGQEQRIAVARALAAQPSVLLLDEPFSALDPGLKDEMQAMIADIRAALNPTIVLVTHDRDEATAMAERIAVLENGQLLQHDTIDRVYHRPASRAVVRLLGGRNAFPGTVIDGEHLSALGVLSLRGLGGESGVAEGPGTLVFRQEAVAVERREPSQTSTRQSVHEPASHKLSGIVTSVVRRGPRRDVSVRVGDAEIQAESGHAVPLAVGDTVVVTVPPESLWVVPE